MHKKIIKKLLSLKNPTSNDLAHIKRNLSKECKMPYPNNISLLREYHNLVKNKRIKKSKAIEDLLRVRPVRSLSGVVNVSVLTKPYACPGICTFCPKEENIPKSYLSGEPAVERAKRLNYDPYLQVKKRIEVLKSTGHNVQKIDLRIIGGTWSYYEKEYKIWFIKECFNACNQTKSNTLFEAQKLNENAKHRIVGLSFETRPDFITKKELLEMRELGTTKVEIGVQSIYDNILKETKRGHNVATTIKATKLLKDAGFKVSYQVMLNLPLSTPKKDLEMLKELFANEDFKPDYLKIYPCALIKNTPLYNDFKKGTYKPYSEKELINLIKEIKKQIPYYVRIERIIRDIPAPLIVKGGAKVSNLRQVIDREIQKENWQCKCIRCREIRNKKHDENIKMFREDYNASSGKEIFLSFEDEKRNNLYSILRLRINSESKALIREVHTFGESKKLKEKGKVQHKGFGKALIKKAEEIVKKEFKLNKIHIISGVGVREYYRKLGYELENYYMVKTF